MSSLSDFLGAAQTSLKGEGQTLGSAAIGSLAQGDVGQAISTLAYAPSQLASTLGSSGGTSFGDDLRGISRRGDAVQSWCWYMVMPDIPDTSAVPLGSIGTIVGGQPLISCPWYYVQTANLPLRTITTESVKRNGHDAHRPSGYNVGQLSVGLFLDSESKAHQYLKAWQGLVLANSTAKVVQNQGNWGYPSSYMKDITLVVLSVRRNLLLNVRFINCWPTELTPVDFTSGEATALVQAVNFMVEDVDITVNNDKGLIDTLISTASGYGLSALSSQFGSGLSNQLNNLVGGL